MNLYNLTAHEAARLLRQREISAIELTQSCLERIYAVDDQVKAYITLIPEVALEAAAEADRRRAAGEDLLLLGIPIAVKDVLCTQGITTTCASRMLEDFVPSYNATVVSLLQEAGVVMLGKTNMDEFAMGSSTENSAFFATHNPWDLERIPGGSSGGSAAAVAAQETILAIGTDTGGSIRLPAALCGITGLKPTYGRVSRFGLVAFASSLDQVGPMTKDVRDAALLLSAIAKYDPQDSTSVNIPAQDYTAALQEEIKGLRIGVPKEYFVAGLEAGTESAIRQALQHLESLGAELIEVSLPHTQYALPAYYLIATAEASANLARYDGVKYGYSYPAAKDLWDAYRRTREAGFGQEVKRRIMLGTYTLSAGYYDAYYLQAQKARTLIKGDFDAAFDQVDVIAAPTSPTAAFKLGERVDDPIHMYLMDIFTLSLNLAGMCGITVPCGFSQGLPVGIQFLGKPFDEAGILRTAYAYQQSTDWHLRRAGI
ncbi:MAG: Asp-tRNA(Asn)/Glu-tRNA(Gln) amidotransferase subunit GatA [Chloroflexi bacterium]|nr:Asp-tRNA(Asn)/Glu-tRNA(Gln) amidotransferase subunit GatA [Chloroflexota bacterium]